MSDYYVVENQSLADIAQAIRDKTGKLDALEFPDEFISEISSISGGDTPVPQDGKTRIFCNFTHSNALSPQFGLGVNGSVDIDWGDDTAHGTLTGTNVATHVATTHTYSSVGEYTITLTPASGTTFSFMGAYNFGSRVLFKATTGVSNENRPYNNSIIKVYIGDGATIRDYAFNNCNALQTVVIPDTITSIGTSAFQNCFSLKNVVIPDEMTSIGGSAFNNCSALLEIKIPYGLTGIAGSAYQYCYSLQNITIPDTVTGIGNYAFITCYSLTSVIIPESVTSMGIHAFNNCNGILEYHFEGTEPLSLASTNSLGVSSDTIIYVPYSSDHSVLDAYKAATNWSTYASQIQEEPQ